MRSRLRPRRKKTGPGECETQVEGLDGNDVVSKDTVKADATVRMLRHDRVLYMKIDMPEESVFKLTIA